MAGHKYTVDLDMQGNAVENLAAPINPDDATNKTYVDVAVAGAGSATVAGAGLTESPAGTLNVGNTDGNLTVGADSVDFSAGAAAVIAAGPASALAGVAPPVVATSGTSSTGVATTAARTDHTHGIALATTSVQGAMSAADKLTLTSYFGNGFYNVVEYGVTTANSGAANLTAMDALLAAATANSIIYFPASTSSYQFSGQITIPAKAFRFQGAGKTKSIIQTNHASQVMFRVGASGTEFMGLRFGTTVTRTGGTAVLTFDFSNVNFYDCYFDSQYDAIEYGGAGTVATLCGVDSYVDNCFFSNTVTYAIIVRGVNSTVQVTNCAGARAAGSTSSYVQIYECASFTMDNCRWKNAVAAFRIDPQAGYPSVRNVAVSNTRFDTSSQGFKAFGAAAGVTIAGVKFVNCAFSGSARGVEIPSNSATVKLSGLKFVNCEFMSNTSHGMDLVAVQDFLISNCTFSGNTSGAGIKVTAAAGSVTRFVITDCTIGPSHGLAGNATGIDILAGTYGSYNISDNTLTGNTVSISDLGTVATTDLKKIINNAGHLIQGNIAANSRGTVTSGTAETLLINARVPAGSVTTGQTFRFTVIGQTSDAGTLIFRTRAGTVGTVAGDTTVIDLQDTTVAQAANSWQKYEGLINVVSIGGSGTVGATGWVTAGTFVTGKGNVAEALATINMNNAWYVDLSCVCNTAGTFTVRYAVIELL